MAGWFQGVARTEIQSRPFLEVTNRELSVFLWQYPGFMRYFAKNKSSYLPGFQYANKQTLDLKSTEDYVIAPPEILFLYHTWKRLISSYTFNLPITPAEFSEFLNKVEEWQPKYWPGASKEYIKLIDDRSYEKVEDLQFLTEAVCPTIVRQAFLGWKNYYKEGDAINAVSPTYSQIEKFLKLYPNYARNFWRNIQEVDGKEVAGEHYLESTIGEIKKSKDDIFPKEQLAPFLKVALYNAEQSLKVQTKE